MRIRGACVKRASDAGSVLAENRIEISVSNFIIIAKEPLPIAIPRSVDVMPLIGGTLVYPQGLECGTHWGVTIGTREDESSLRNDFLEDLECLMVLRDYSRYVEYYRW
jgi:hypothetical protein